MNELALFAGHGGGILGGILCGFRTVCAVEINDYARRVLMARQDDGCLPAFPIWDDVRTFDGRSWRGLVDVITGGFPCQDISIAGKGEGISGERSGLWGEMFRIIREVEPRYVIVENSPMLTRRGLEQVIGDLASLGYDAKWGVLGAIHAGAPHKRERIWIVAHSATLRIKAGSPNSEGWKEGVADQSHHCRQDVADTNNAGREQQRRSGANGEEYGATKRSDWWSSESGVGRMADGVAWRVDRLSGLGNGQVPAVAALAWRILSGAGE
jgi:DNA (cytosine-5)-methyltransferase 1